MERTVTVSVKGLLVAAVVLLALLAAYLLGGAGGTAPAPAGAATTTEQPEVASGDARTLRMVGAGEATVVPDQLTFSLSVTSKRLELDDALASSSATMRRVLGVLEDLGVRTADVQTTGLQMHPEYDYPDYGPPVLTGYRVTQRAQVKVRQLADGGKAVSAAIEAGGNGVRVGNIRLGVSDPEAALGRARDAAVEAATAKAERYAAATGQSLGEVLALRELGSDTPRRTPVLAGYAARDAVELQSAMPVKAGRDDLDVRVEVVWAFE
jgi:hypothetical protein